MSTRVTGYDAVLLKLTQTLLDKLGQQNLELFTAGGPATYNLALAAANLARLLADFYAVNERPPTIMFNDGKPPSALAQLQSRPAFGTLLNWQNLQVPQGVNEESGQEQSRSIGVPVVNVAVYTSGVDVESVSYSGENQTPTTTTVRVEGAFNSRYASGFGTAPIPLDAIIGGAAPNWILILVAVDHPEMIHVTDEGMMLDPGGVALVEKSLAFWAEEYMRFRGESFEYGFDEFFSPGPVLPGWPVSTLEKFYSMYIEAKQHGWRDFFLMIVEFILSAVALYAGVSGLNGMVQGALTLSNATSALTLADKFGVETSEVTGALKLLNLTQGYLPVNNGGLMGEDEFFDFTALDPEFIDPTTIDWGVGWDPFAGMDSDVMSAITSGDFARLDREVIPIMDTGGTGDFARADRFGTITLGGTEVFQPFEVKMYADGVKTPEFQQAAMQQATQRVAERAATAGIPMSMSDITKFASESLKIMGQFYTLQTQAQMMQARARLGLPGGAMMQTLANGTRTLTYPDGRVVTLPSVGGASLIPGIPNQYLLYGAMGVAALFAVSSLRR